MLADGGSPLFGLLKFVFVPRFTTENCRPTPSKQKGGTNPQCPPTSSAPPAPISLVPCSSFFLIILKKIALFYS